MVPSSLVHMPLRTTIPSICVFCRTNQTFGFFSQPANSASMRLTGVLVRSSLTASVFLPSSCLYALWLCNNPLTPHYTLCDGGHRSPEYAVPTLSQVFCGAAHKESHLPFQLSGMRRVDSPGLKKTMTTLPCLSFQRQKKKIDLYA